MGRAPWSVQAIAFVRACYEAGDTDAEIGIGLGRSAASVSNLRQAEGITRPRAALKRSPEWTEGELAIAAMLYACGEPNEAIAEAVGRSRIAIKRLVTGRGLKRDPSAVIDLSRFDTEHERWQREPGGLAYAISTAGNVISLHPGKIGLPLSQWTDSDGYKHVQLQSEVGGKRYAVHRLVVRTFKGEPPTPAHQAAHGDGDPSNNREDNLRWATPAENQSDRLAHGTADRAADGRFVSTADMVRKARAAGLPVVEARL